MPKWVKGQSGNPNGRPKRGTALTERLQARLQEQAYSNQKGSNKQFIVDRLLTLAREGDLDAIKYIFDRVDGRPVQALEHGGVGGAPLTIVFKEGKDVP